MENEPQVKRGGTMGNCVVCGKQTPVKDMRSVRRGDPIYCGRVHQALARFSTRYSGTNAGKYDRPSTDKLLDKTKWKSTT